MNDNLKCELCGNVPGPLQARARCHPTAPLRLELDGDGTLKAFCYIPSCNREVMTVKIAERIGDERTQAEAWCEVFELCRSLGMEVGKKANGAEDVKAFIKGLVKR